MLGNALREARLKAELTQEELALRAGVDRTFISILERGLQSPTVDMLIRLARAMDIRASDILRRIEGVYQPKGRRARSRPTRQKDR
jgi:transcriptional regulator with XRE-family HTH domain